MITKSREGTTQQYRALYHYGAFGLPGMSLEESAEYLLASIPESTYVYSKTDGSDTIQYEVGKKTFNECLHIQDTLRILDRDQPFYYGFYNATSDKWYTHVVLGTYFAPQAPSDASSDEVDEEFRKRAWAELLPQLNDGFGLLNFLWELPEVLILAKSAWNLGTYLRKLFGEHPEIMKPLSEWTLTYQFGIKPLVMDIVDLGEKLADLDKLIQDFIDDGKKPNSYHYREDSGVSESLEASTGTDLKYLGTRVIKCATLKCTYEYQLEPGLGPYLRLLGLRITPEHIWNAIPFSFVIDWVLRVADYLRQLDVDPGVRVNIIDYCDSIKTTSYRKVMRNPSPTYSGNECTLIGKAGDVWLWEKTRYHRTPGLPNTGVALPAMDSLSLRELVLGGALLIANS